MITYCFINRKSQKWTTKLCFHVLNITSYNTFVLYKKFKNIAQTYLQYLMAIMKKLSNNSLPDSLFLSNIVVVENLISIDLKTIVHFPIRLPRISKCQYCSTSTKKTSIGCACCDVSLCTVPCCVFWHNNQS
jgi:hypothetical protein